MFPLISGEADNDKFHADLYRIGNGGYESLFFTKVFEPMECVHHQFKQYGPAAALDGCNAIKASDWQLAARQWLERRIERKQRAQDSGVNYE